MNDNERKDAEIRSIMRLTLGTEEKNPKKSEKPIKEKKTEEPKEEKTEEKKTEKKAKK